MKEWKDSAIEESKIVLDDSAGFLDANVKVELWYLCEKC